jgi:hypothetical protein
MKTEKPMKHYRYLRVWGDGPQQCYYDVWIEPDGSLHNPHNYPEELARAAALRADERKAERLRKAAELRRERREAASMRPPNGFWEREALAMATAAFAATSF